MSDDPLNAHAHDNNTDAPDGAPDITVELPDGTSMTIPHAGFQILPRAEIAAYEYTTDHGRHGPYRLEGVALDDLLATVGGDDYEWQSAEIVSADGYGNRLARNEIEADTDTPILLCDASDNVQLSRQLGLIRLVVPTETDNALRQIKWVQTIRLV